MSTILAIIITGFMTALPFAIIGGVVVAIRHYKKTRKRKQPASLNKNKSTFPPEGGAMNNNSIQKLNLDKLVKVSVIIAILLIAFSTMYYFVIRPVQKERLLQRCLTDSEFRKSLNLPQTHPSPGGRCYDRF